MTIEVLKYKISDFIMFSQEALNAVYAQYNEDIWPAQIVWILLSAVVFYLLVFRRHHSHYIFLHFSGAWIFTGVYFYKQHFSSINIAAEYVFYVFVFQALLYLFAFYKKISTLYNLLLYILLFILFFIPIDYILRESFAQVSLFGWGSLALSLAGISLALAMKNLIYKLFFIPIPITICAFTLINHFYAK